MMKEAAAMRCRILLLCAFLIILPVIVLADPTLSNGSSAAWIGENSWLYLENETGTVKYMPTTMADIPAINDTDLFCITASGSLWSVRLDGTSSSIVAQIPTENDLAAIAPVPGYALEQGELRIFASSQIVQQVIAVCDNGRDVFYIIQDDDMSCRISMSSLTNETISLVSISREVPEPISLYASAGYVTITAEDHSICLIDLQTWTIHTFPAFSSDTCAAVCQDGKLFRYTRTSLNAWQTETYDNLNDLLNGTSASVPASRGSVTAAPSSTTTTPTATPKAPTATPKPTVTPKPAKTATAAPTAKATATADGYKIVSYGDRGADVKTMQRRLRALGYLNGSADGAFGEQTLTALHLFQFAIGYTERSYASEKCLSKLYAANAPVYDPYRTLVRGEHGTPVSLMQLRLTELGYATGKIDGKYGTNTVAAVAAFQQTAGLPVNGEIAGT